MQIADAVQVLDRAFPLGMQQAYDACGFQCGRANRELQGIMVGLDVNEAMIEEAEQSGCNLLVTHHPLLFHPMRRLGEGTRVERLVHLLLEKGLCAYAAHTNLDAMPNGVNGVVADTWGLVNRQALEPLKAPLRQLVVYVPSACRIRALCPFLRLEQGSWGITGRPVLGCKARVPSCRWRGLTLFWAR